MHPHGTFFVLKVIELMCHFLLLCRGGRGGRGQAVGIEAYYSHDMVEDPWAALRPQVLRQFQQQQQQAASSSNPKPPVAFSGPPPHLAPRPKQYVQPGLATDGGNNTDGTQKADDAQKAASRPWWEPASASSQIPAGNGKPGEAAGQLPQQPEGVSVLAALEAAWSAMDRVDGTSPDR